MEFDGEIEGSGVTVKASDYTDSESIISRDLFHHLNYSYNCLIPINGYFIRKDLSHNSKACKLSILGIMDFEIDMCLYDTRGRRFTVRLRPYVVESDFDDVVIGRNLISNVSSRGGVEVLGRRVTFESDRSDELIKLTLYQDSFSFIRSGYRNKYVVVYVDGSCFGNGRSNPAPGIGLYWGNHHPLNIIRSGDLRSTNNGAELEAVILALKTALANNEIQNLIIRTDSLLTVNSATKWIRKWRRNDWRSYNGSPVKNQSLLKTIDDLLYDARCCNIDVQFVHIPGHKGEYGNEMANKFAQWGAKKFRHC